jgi:NAD(P)-dependent dehydrogenase (short-subunit alcohol dehydrogenase family)
MSQCIQNSVAFVSGANRGIGRAIVESLLSRGAAKV